MSTISFHSVIKAMSYTNKEYVDMNKISEACNGNFCAAIRYYRGHFPNRRIPNRRTIQRVERSLLEYGSFELQRRDCGCVRRINIEDNVLNDINNNLQQSATSLGSPYNISNKTIRCILHDNSMHPYHLTPVQALSNRDYMPRMIFVHLLLQEHENDPEVTSYILRTNKAQLTRNF